MPAHLGPTGSARPDNRPTGPTGASIAVDASTVDQDPDGDQQLGDRPDGLTGRPAEPVSGHVPKMTAWRTGAGTGEGDQPP